jgi:hypothetical protein
MDGLRPSGVQSTIRVQDGSSKPKSKRSSRFPSRETPEGGGGYERQQSRRISFGSQGIKEATVAQLTLLKHYASEPKKRESPKRQHSDFRKPAGLLASQVSNPFLQDCLAARLKFAEGNSHPRVRFGVNHHAECGKACAAMRNFQRDFRALWEWT